MKTLAVFAALAAVAAAVPALPGYRYDGYRPVHYRLPAQYRREKKSPQELTIEPAPAFDVPALELDRPELELNPDVSARTIGLKKPIIVKKKFGYHLYRDSNEEQAQADPQEKCTKEVKVKLCDADASAMKMRSAGEDSNAPLTENEMKQSIKMAKDAVENLQKMTQFQNAQLGPDAEMHEDIEVARQALEHVQKNFGHLESMNLQATTLSDAQALKDAHFQIASKDNERMAQWKEAIDNIQKNVEIAKNIEDSFKSSKISPKESESIKKMKSSESVVIEDHNEKLKEKSSDDKEAKHEESLTKELGNPKEKHAEHEEKAQKTVENDVAFKSTAENNEMSNKSSENKELVKKTAEQEEPLKKIEHDLSLQKNAEEAPFSKNVEEFNPKKDKKDADHEMDTSPSEHKEIKLTLDEKLVKSKEAENIKIENNGLEKETIVAQDKQGKSTDFDSSASLMEKSADQDALSKVTNTENKAKKIEHQPKQSEAMEDLTGAQSAPVMESVPAPALDSHHLAKSSEKEITQEKNEIKEDMKLSAKASNSAPDTNEKIEAMSRMEHEKANELVVDTTTLMKNAEPNIKQEKHLINTAETQSHFKDAHEMLQYADNKEQAKQHEAQRSLQPLRSANNAADPHLPPRTAAAMRPQDQHNVPLPHHEDFEFRSEGKNWHADKMSAKNDDTLHGNADFERNAHFNQGLENGHSSGQFSSFAGAHANAGAHGHFDQQFHNHHGHHGPHGPHGQHGMHKFHGKTADADSMVQATQMNSIDDHSKAAAEQWKQKEAARGAYGAYGAAAGVGAGAGAGALGGAGAVGVFPGANVGGCAIPLLLSCSPSVVPGSLAKSSYGAHSYRAGEDFLDNRFHHKRDTKKINEIPSTKVKRTPTKVIQKNLKRRDTRL